MRNYMSKEEYYEYVYAEFSTMDYPLLVEVNS
jgi:hypothetical protein